MQFKNKIYFVLITSGIFLTGCMVGPKYNRQETIADKAGWSFENASYSSDSNNPGRWWERFNDDTTNQLVEKAIARNYDIRIAAAQVLQAEATYKIAGGALLPHVTANSDSQLLRQNSGPPGSALEKTGRVTKTRTYTNVFSVSYVLDLFGGLRHAKQSQYNKLLASKADKNAVINSLIASVINARINIAAMQNRLAIAKSNAESLGKTLNIVEDRYKLGLVGPVDVRLARQNYAAAQSAIPDYELSLRLAQNAIDVLIAVQPGKTKPISDTIADLPLPQTIPVGLPATLLQRRPDIVAAEFKLKAQNEKIGQSIANMYPSLTFTGSMGWRSNASDSIFVDEAWLYSALLSISQPIFMGGQLKAQVEYDKALFSQHAAQYAKTVVTAMREVEDQAASENLLRKRLQYAQISFDEAKAAEILARDRYSRGVETLLTVLETERRRNSAEDSLAILKGQIWNARVNLFLALGGDWTG
ncbi:MAG: efflux transporter outer membrane subunit [Planctomycetaceae bacterium]|nr:efflux transporter outer membrane subunit [Planctomycetaceae bacterium]